MHKKYYYPDNMQAESLFARFWNGKDFLVIIALLVFALLFVIFLHIWILFAVLFIYAFASAKLYENYSISKLAKLYIRFLITDTLIFKWRR